jgi:hypothetical protein
MHALRGEVAIERAASRSAACRGVVDGLLDRAGVRRVAAAGEAGKAEREQKG